MVNSNLSLKQAGLPIRVTTKFPQNHPACLSLDPSGSLLAVNGPLPMEVSVLDAFTLEQVRCCCVCVTDDSSLSLSIQLVKINLKTLDSFAVDGTGSITTLKFFNHRFEHIMVLINPMTDVLKVTSSWF
jgi:hypothetical protein